MNAARLPRGACMHVQLCLLHFRWFRGWYLAYCCTLRTATLACWYLAVENDILPYSEGAVVWLRGLFPVVFALPPCVTTCILALPLPLQFRAYMQHLCNRLVLCVSGCSDNLAKLLRLFFAETCNAGHFTYSPRPFTMICGLLYVYQLFIPFPLYMFFHSLYQQRHAAWTWLPHIYSSKTKFLPSCATCTIMYLLYHLTDVGLVIWHLYPYYWCDNPY